MVASEEAPIPLAFRWPIRVYYEDTDAGGLVYHANYVRFMERARTERLRAHGFELDGLQRDHGIMFVVRSMALDFLKPARFNESLWVTADIEETRAASIYFRQAVLRGEDEILCQAKVRVVSISAET
ncbi:tol-pal system-associated acyl-CoA thioesterase, partial [Methylomagnum sp.]